MRGVGDPEQSLYLLVWLMLDENLYCYQSHTQILLSCCVLIMNGGYDKLQVYGLKDYWSIRFLYRPWCKWYIEICMMTYFRMEFIVLLVDKVSVVKDALLWWNLHCNVDKIVSLSVWKLFSVAFVLLSTVSQLCQNSPVSQSTADFNTGCTKLLLPKFLTFMWLLNLSYDTMNILF